MHWYFGKQTKQKTVVYPNDPEVLKDDLKINHVATAITGIWLSVKKPYTL